MKIFNRYTYLLLGLIVISSIVVSTLIPNLQTEEFDQNVIDDIIDGVTTTTVQPATNEEPEGIENILNQEEVISPMSSNGLKIGLIYQKKKKINFKKNREEGL